MKRKIQQLLAKFLSRSKGIKRVDLGLAIFVTFVALAIYIYTQISGRNAAGLRFIENVEARSLDARFNLRGARSHDENIVIVGLEETTLQKVGAFPIPRNAYAKMVDQLRRDGARLLVFDVNFPLPEKNSAVDALKKLERSIEGQANAAVVQKIREIEATSDNDKILAKSLKDAGNVILGHLFLDAERAKSVDAAGAQAYIAENGIDHIELGSHNLRTSRDGTVLVNYAGPYRTYKHYPMVDVVDGRFAPGTFKNKLVVFGATAVAVGDTRTTPFHDADYM